MNCLETLIQGKHPEAHRCEDMLFYNGTFAAVIDGATDKFGFDYQGVTGGYLVAQTIQKALGHLPPEADAREAIDLISRAVDQVLSEFDVPKAYGRACASLVMFSKARREVWRVGDSHWRTEHEIHLGTKLIDEVHTAARVTFAKALLRENPDLDLRTHLADSSLIKPSLDKQWVFQNLDDPEEPLAFGVIDGTRVPDRFIEITPLDSSTQKLVLASDGYPFLHLSVSETEKALQQDLIEDPFRIKKHRHLKSHQHGLFSFDDRAMMVLDLC